MQSRRAFRGGAREFGSARSTGALVLAAFTLTLLGSAPPRDHAAEAIAWGTRVEARLGELDAVGVDSTPYRAELAKARVLAQRGFHPEALLALRHLAADVEGWQPEPSPPRRPAEALLDATDRPRTWDPLEEGGEALPEGRGYGGFRLAPGDPQKAGVAIYRRPLSGPSRLDWGNRIRQARLKEAARVAQSSASRRRSDWTEEADHPAGAVPGRVEARVGGGAVLEGEDDPDPGADALVGNDGVGFYGSVLRMARQGIFPKDVPDLPRPPTGDDAPFDRGPTAAGLKQAIVDAPDEGSVPEGDDAPGPGRDPTPAPPTRPPPPDPTPDPGPALDPELEDPELEDPLPDGPAPDRPTPPADPDPLEDPDLDPELDPELPPGPGPKKAEGPATASSLDALYADRRAFHEKVLALDGKLGPTADPRESHVRELGGWTDVRGMTLFSLEEGALQVDVLAPSEDLVGLRKAARIRVEGLYLHDPARTGKSPDQLLVARRVRPLP